MHFFMEKQTPFLLASRPARFPQPADAVLSPFHHTLFFSYYEKKNPGVPSFLRRAGILCVSVQLFTFWWTTGVCMSMALNSYPRER